MFNSHFLFGYYVVKILLFFFFFSQYFYVSRTVLQEQLSNQRVNIIYIENIAFWTKIEIYIFPGRVDIFKTIIFKKLWFKYNWNNIYYLYRYISMSSMIFFFFLDMIALRLTRATTPGWQILKRSEISTIMVI